MHNRKHSSIGLVEDSSPEGTSSASSWDSIESLMGLHGVAGDTYLKTDVDIARQEVCSVMLKLKSKEHALHIKEKQLKVREDDLQAAEDSRPTDNLSPAGNENDLTPTSTAPILPNVEQVVKTRKKKKKKKKTTDPKHTKKSRTILRRGSSKFNLKLDTHLVRRANSAPNSGANSPSTVLSPHSPLSAGYRPLGHRSNRSCSSPARCLEQTPLLCVTRSLKDLAHLHWSANDVHRWIESLGPILSVYADRFRENAITGATLGMLNRGDLAEMGIVLIGHRLLILREIGSLVNKSSP